MRNITPKYIPISNVADIISGGTPNTNIKEYWGGGIPWLSVADFNTGCRWVNSADKSITTTGLENSPVNMLKERDIIISARGTVGAIAQVIRPMAFNQSCYGLRGKEGISDTDYLYYALKDAVDEMKEKSHGAVFSTIIKNTFSLISIPIWPLPEQRRIAHILGTLDDRIENNRKTAKTLEAMAQAIFKSWFVDFDPVRAKMAGEPRESICKRLKLTPEILDLFPDRLVDSELGEIPEGWEVTTLTALSRLNPESWTKAKRPKLINYVDLSNTKLGRIESVIIYTKEAAPSRAQRILRPDDTIVGTVRPGNGSFALIAENGLTGSTGFAVLRPKKTIYAAFVYFAVTAEENIQSLAHLADGGAYPAVRPEVVAGTHIAMPCDELLTIFSRITRALLEEFATIGRQCSTLIDLRDTLLPKLISGEIRVPEAEHLIQATMETVL